MKVFLYLLSIVVANVITAKFSPINLGLFIIPWGSFLIGATFVLRDLTQEQIGRKKTYLAIASALVLSGISSMLLGDGLQIVFASLVAFIVSETFDTELFTRLKMKFEKRVLISGTVGGILDSAIFVILGLSPIGAGFVPWNFVIYAILGQMVIKVAMQFVGVLLLKGLRK